MDDSEEFTGMSERDADVRMVSEADEAWAMWYQGPESTVPRA